MEHISTFATNAATAPGRVLFGTDLLDLTAKAEAAGENLTGRDIREAEFHPATGGYFVRGANEAKHYTADGLLDN